MGGGAWAKESAAAQGDAARDMGRDHLWRGPQRGRPRQVPGQASFCARSCRCCSLSPCCACWRWLLGKRCVNERRVEG